MKSLLVLSTVIVASFSLTACLGGAASAVGQGVASHAVDGAIQRGTAQRMTCEEIEKDIADRSRGKINPLAIPTINRQIAHKEAVAREKGCPGFAIEAAEKEME